MEVCISWFMNRCGLAMLGIDAGAGLARVSVPLAPDKQSPVSGGWFGPELLAMVCGLSLLIVFFCSRMPSVREGVFPWSQAM